MAGSYTGEGAKLQIGKGSTWGTVVAPTVEIDMLDESLSEDQNVITEDTLVGKATQGRSDVMGKKVTGSWSQLVKADNIGLVLACALGTEAAPSDEGDGVYAHAFTLITGSAEMLPMLTAVVDKRTSVYGFASNKISTFALQQDNNDYLRATVDVIGRTEAADSLEALTLSVLAAFNFNGLTVEVDDTALNEVTSVSLNLNNNLEDDLYVADGSSEMIEIDRQRREPVIEMEVLWNPDIESLRDNNYKTATPAKVELIWTGAIAGGALPYSLTVLAENAYIVDDPMAPIPGPERLRTTLTWRCASIGSDEPLTITLQDKQSTAYLA